MSDVASLISVLSRFGDLGLVIAFFIWWNVWTAKRYDKNEEQRRARRAVEDEKRLNFDKERLAMDKELSSSLAALTSAVQNMGRRG